MAKLYFYYSAMNAGKSTVLLQSAFNYRERGMRVLLFAPTIDTRAGVGRILSRVGLSDDATPLTAQDDLFVTVSAAHVSSAVACVLIDEAQFLTIEQVWQAARIVDRLKLPVLCYGLRTDFKGNLFPGSGALLGIADELCELKTICECGRKATMNLRIGADGKAVLDGAQVEIGGNERYISVCRHHYCAAVGRA